MEFLDAALRGLNDAVRSHRVDLTLCGGDFTDLGSESEIAHASKLFRGWTGPLAVCLGNHDLACADSLARWRATVGDMMHLADNAIDVGAWTVLLMNTAWELDGEPGWQWKPVGAPIERLMDAQIDWLESQLSKSRDRPTILVIHAPTHALPPALTGRGVDLHVPSAAYTALLDRMLDLYPQVKLVLSGHNHVTCARRHPGRIHLSLSSIVEPPFEYCLIRTTPRSLHAEVRASIPLPATARYDPAKAWVNGRPSDRTIEMTW